MGSGLVINGKAEMVDGLCIQNWLDNPNLRLGPNDRRARYSTEKVCAVVVHTTKGIPGGTNHTPQVILPGVGESSRAGERIVGSWTLDPTPAGAHFIVDFDGRIYCCADLASEAAYHAQLANGASIGIEMMQGSDASLYSSQLDTTVQLVVALCERFGISKRIPLPYAGKPVPSLTGRLDGISGVFGHRDLTNTRGQGDPGDEIMARLEAAGFARYDFSSGC